MNLVENWGALAKIQIGTQPTNLLEAGFINFLERKAIKT